MACLNNLKEISCLPENIIFHILSYLPVKERCIAGRVCKHWRKIIASNSLWRHVDLLEYRLNLPRMWKILRTHFTSSLLSLRINCGYVQSGYNETSVSNALLKQLQARCPNINTLQLHDCNTSKFSLSCIPSTLTCLGITNSSWSHHWLKDVHSHLKNLSSLDLSNTVDSCNFNDIAQWTELRTLSLCGSYCVGSLAMEVIAKSLTSLEVLNLSSTSIDHFVIIPIAQHCKNLQQLLLKNCKYMTDLCLAKISSGLKCLEVLDVSMCENFSLEGLKVLWSLKKLKQLRFATEKFNEEDVESFRTGFIQNMVQDRWTPGST